MRSSSVRLSTLARLFALALPVVWFAVDRTEAAAALAPGRGVSGQSLLTLGGSAVGNVRSAEGGSAVATVVEEMAARGAPPKKHIVAVGYEDIVLELDLSLERPVYDWIGAAWKGMGTRQSGSLVSFDQNREPRDSREFQNAVIVETRLAACDVSAKAPGTLTLLLAPERMTEGAAAAGKLGPSPGKGAKVWLTSNFRLEIDGLDATRVMRIEPIVFKQTLATSPVGAIREPTAQLGKLQFGNLQITLAETGSESWRKWHEEFVVAGNASDKNERSGRLLLLGADLKDELAVIQFQNLGIIALRPRASGPGIPQIQAELYAERMEFSVAGPPGK